MDRAHVLENEIAIRVEKLLIIGAVEATTVDADRIQMPQLESYARRGGRDTTGGPTYVEELEGPACYLFPSSHAHPV